MILSAHLLHTGGSTGEKAKEKNKVTFTRRSRGLRSPDGSRARLNCCLTLSLGGDGSNVKTMFGFLGIVTSTGTLTLLIDV